MNEDDDIVQGIVLMRRGERSTPSIEAVKAEVAKIEAAGILPPGVRIERIYDRAGLGMSDEARAAIEGIPFPT